MLIITNRTIDTKASGDAVFTTAFTPFVDTLHCATVKPAKAVNAVNANPSWQVSALKPAAGDSVIMNAVGSVLKLNKPVLFYLHGNNNTPADCFARCQELEDQYNVSVIGFSWASEGFLPSGQDEPGLSTAKANTDLGEQALTAVTSRAKLAEGWIARKARRYGHAKLNAQNSVSALARCFRLIGRVWLDKPGSPVSLAAHSLGCHFLHYTVQDPAAAASLAVMHNVALLAGCTGAAKHASWVSQIHPRLRVYIAFTQADSVLAAAALVDGDTKLGADPGTERLAGPKVRYIDFAGAAHMPLGAHRYFVAPANGSLSRQAATLFGRIFTSAADFSPPAESPKVVYPLGCIADGSVCFMGAASKPGEA